MIRGAFLLLLLAPGLVLAWPWSRDLMNQPSIKPQEGVMAPFPKRSVPVGGYPTPVDDRLKSYWLANPVAATPTSIARGQQFFTIFCVPCHGESGQGDGTVARKLPVPPMDLSNAFIQEQTFDNWVFAQITYGGPIMPAYANDLSPAERWDIVNYIRHGLVKAKDISAGAHQ